MAQHSNKVFTRSASSPSFSKTANFHRTLTSASLNRKKRLPSLKEKTKADVPKLSAKEAFRSFVYDALKNVFSLSVKEDEEMNITVDNIFPLMKALELDTKDEIIIDMIHEACIETFGNIDIIEFDNNIMDQRKRVKGEEFELDIKSAFRTIDVDNDGFITVPDLYQLMMGIGEMLTDDELSELLCTADHNGDGKVCYKDFKYFLTGELDEDPIEETEKADEQTEGKEPEVKETELEVKDDVQNETDTKEEGNVIQKKTEDSENNESVDEGKIDDKNEESVNEENIHDTNNDESIKEEKDKAERQIKRQGSILWTFASKKTDQESDEKADKKEEKSQAISTPIEEIKEEDETVLEEEEDENEDETVDETKHVTSVSVSIKETTNTEQEDLEEKPLERKITDAMMRAFDTRPKRMRMAERDSGIEVGDIDKLRKELGSISDDGFHSGANSVKTYDKSRASSAKTLHTSRPSTAKSIFELSGEESVYEEGMQQIDDEATENEMDIVHECDFDDPLNKRQKDFLDNGIEQQIYCEAGVERKEAKPNPFDDLSDNDTLDLDSIIEDDLEAITPRVNLTRLKNKSKENDAKLVRSKSAARLRTFKKIESVLLRRQNTDPLLNIVKVRAANSKIKQEEPKLEKKRNNNGLCCTHISIDLNIEMTEEKPKSLKRPLTAYSSRKYVPKMKSRVSTEQVNEMRILSRPQTAMTFREAERSNNIMYSNKPLDVFSAKNQTERDLKIIDLSKSVSVDTIDTNRFEKPGLSTHHHGYKSVLPLGRVLSGNKKKVNNGNGILLNSLSRKLERIGHSSHLTSSRQSDIPKPDVLKIPTVSNGNQKQSIITLELPPDVRSRGCRRMMRSNNVRIQNPLIKI